MRFAKPVIPGQTLRTDMWRDNKRIHFQTSVVETGVPVVTGKFLKAKIIYYIKMYLIYIKNILSVYVIACLIIC